MRDGDQAGAVAELDAALAELKTEQLRALCYALPQVNDEIVRITHEELGVNVRMADPTLTRNVTLPL